MVLFWQGATRVGIIGCIRLAIIFAKIFAKLSTRPIGLKSEGLKAPEF
jgi:hypothetical protein